MRLFMDQMPKAISQNWKQLASVQVGGAICLPLLLVGYELAKGGNLKNQLFSVFIGNALLFTFALVAGFMSANRKLTTVEHASIYFGEKAKKFFALTMSFSMLGWFAIQTQCMGGDVYHLMQQLKVGPHFQGEFWRTTLCFILAILMLGGGHSWVCGF